MLDPHLIKKIISAWRADETQPYHGRQVRHLPPFEAIQKFIDLVFLASFKKEEGQLVRFAVALVIEGDPIDTIVPTMFPPVRLTSPPNFSDESLVKIAGAFDPELTTIVVQWNSEQQLFSYWGLTFHAPSVHTQTFANNPVSVEGSANFRPDFFTAIVRGPALIAITRENSLIGTLQAGNFIPAKATPFRSTSLGQYIHKEIQRDPLFTLYGLQYLDYAMNALMLLLFEAAERCHGGTIVLLPSRPTQDSEIYKSKYKLEGSYELKQTLTRCIQNKDSKDCRVAYEKVAAETIKRIAQLAAIDGALILTFDFEVVSFGATLTAKRSELKLVAGPDGFDKTAADFEINRYGTRHRSAFDFVSAQSNAIAFVISQDGPIRAFRRKDKSNVYVWPDCTNSVYV